AKALSQSAHQSLTDCIREHARSHMDDLIPVLESSQLIRNVA
ncbi:MAG: hypothetical protein QOI97_2034, partial [Pseudomonas sp.]|nr:hypothetical protein [Pseudomonas sp.]